MQAQLVGQMFGKLTAELARSAARDSQADWVTALREELPAGQVGFVPKQNRSASRQTAAQ